MTINFESFDFTVTALTEAGVITPLSFEFVETKDGVVATSNSCVYFGDERRPCPGQLTLTIGQLSAGGITWKVDASMQHLIKGVKVKIDPIPGTKLVSAEGNPFEIKESLLYDAFGREIWNAEAFYNDLERAERAGLMPTLLIGKPDIDLNSKEARAVFAAADRFRNRLK